MDLSSPAGPKVPTLSESVSVPRSVATRHLSGHHLPISLHRSFAHPKEARSKRNPLNNAKMESYPGGDSVSTEAVAARRHAGTHLPVTWWKLEMPTTTWHLLLN